MTRSIKLIYILGAFLAALSCKNSSTENKAPVIQTDTTTVRKPDATVYLYGIPASSYNLVKGKIKRNGFLSSLLLQHGITMDEIDKLIRNSVAVFDVRKIRSGNSYTLFCDRDSAARARYLVYEHDAAVSYIFSFNDSLNITPWKKDVKNIIKYTSFSIETSMWDALMNGGFHPSLAVELSDVFAWTVDFFGLQKGDSFKVIYEEMLIDNKPIQVTRIIGAQFSGPGTVITAVPFIQDGKESFYDTKGNCLRKAFLKAPLDFARVTSRFSSSRLHPILRIRRPHYGVDYAAPIGTPVHAIGDGRVTQTGYENGSGRIVRINHNSVYSTAYLHLSRFAEGIVPGAYVKQNEIIGYVGSSGLSTGPHLDFRFYKNGYPVDPLRVEAPPVDPVSPENMEKYEKVKTVVLSLLDTF
ncbi:MAG: peptidoglycan DD-metalloendopeptidase family protein [Bacteroidota bacterium]|nr:peptidoglycan DD-metalloendopeptidase family protein [Bacteroidota bacterium]